MLKVDFHIHTTYSPDSIASPKSIVARALKVGINCLAITDHNRIAGAFKVREIAPFPVIIGEEIMTTHGEIIGYFLTEEIPKWLSPEEVVSRIKGQGGIVCIPHPFDRFVRTSPLRGPIAEKLLPSIDVIEVFNSRSLFSSDTERARIFAEKNGFLASAGSDAHTAGEVGNAYVEMPEFEDVAGFLESLRQGEVFGHKTPPFVHILSTVVKLPAKLKIRRNV